MEGSTEAMTPMADLAARWGVNANTVSRRIKFLGIKPIRKGNFRYLDPEQMELAEQLQAHILAGKAIDDFPRPDGEATAMARSSQVTRLVPDDALLRQMSAAFAASQQQALPVPSPLKQAQDLKRAADEGLPLTQPEMSKVLGRSVGPDDHETSPRPGFILRRIEHSSGKTNKEGKPQKPQVFWIVVRNQGEVTSIKPADQPMGGGMLGGFAARALLDVTAIDCSGSDLFDRMKL